MKTYRILFVFILVFFCVHSMVANKVSRNKTDKINISVACKMMSSKDSLFSVIDKLSVNEKRKTAMLNTASELWEYISKLSHMKLDTIVRFYSTTIADTNGSSPNTIHYQFKDSIASNYIYFTFAKINNKWLLRGFALHQIGAKQFAPSYGE